MATEEVEGEEFAVKSCKRCSHLNVCAVYRAICPLINSFEVKKPFNPDDLAKICAEFTLICTFTPKEFSNARKLKR